MGRSRGQTLEIDAHVEAATPPEESGGENAASLFDASGDARVRILRRDDTTQKYVTHGYFPPDANEETVSMAFGGGTYKAQLVIPDPASGLLKIKRSRDFRIPGAYKPPAKISTFEEAGQNPPAASGGASSSVPSIAAPGGDDLMAVLKAGIINTLLDVMKQSKQTPGTDPMLLEFIKSQTAMQQQMFTLLITMMQQTKQEPQNSESRDYLTMLAKMKEILSPANGGTGGANPMEMFNTMLETFTRLRETAEDIVPQRGGDVDPIMGSIPKLVEVVAEQHQMQKANRAAMTTVPVPGPAGGVAQMPVVHSLPEQSPPMPQLPLWRMALRQQAKRVVAAATAKQDPDVLAGAAILFAPPALVESLRGFFHRDEAEVMADVLTEIPELAEHREWLAEFVNAAQYRLFPDEFTEEESPEQQTESKTE